MKTVQCDDFTAYIDTIDTARLPKGVCIFDMSSLQRKLDIKYEHAKDEFLLSCSSIAFRVSASSSQGTPGGMNYTRRI